MVKRNAARSDRVAAPVEGNKFVISVYGSTGFHIRCGGVETFGPKDENNPFRSLRGVNDHGNEVEGNSS